MEYKWIMITLLIIASLLFIVAYKSGLDAERLVEQGLATRVIIN